MEEMKLTAGQKQRLIALLGPRYFKFILLNNFTFFMVRYKNSDVFTLVCEMYPTIEENFTKVFEMAKELYWESLRAV